jgi:protein-tyrosine phosphatase
MSWLRRSWVRLVHPWRRRRVLALLARHRMPRGVLFVCHGNICRSPYAAAAFRARLGPEAANVIHVASAGFIGPIRAAPRYAQEEAAARGLDLRDHRSMTLSPVVLRSVDIVVVMEPEQAGGVTRMFPTTASIVVLGDLDPVADGGRSIIDPLDRPRAVFAASYDRIDRCVAVLAEAVAG